MRDFAHGRTNLFVSRKAWIEWLLHVLMTIPIPIPMPMLMPMPPWLHLIMPKTLYVATTLLLGMIIRRIISICWRHGWRVSSWIGCIWMLIELALAMLIDRHTLCMIDRILCAIRVWCWCGWIRAASNAAGMLDISILSELLFLLLLIGLCGWQWVWRAMWNDLLHWCRDPTNSKRHLRLLTSGWMRWIWHSRTLQKSKQWNRRNRHYMQNK